VHAAGVPATAGLESALQQRINKSNALIYNAHGHSDRGRFALRGKMNIKTGTAGTLRRAIAGAETIVVKVGTKVLVREDGNVATDVLGRITESVADLRTNGRDVALVSSGAVGIGAGHLKISPEMVSVCAATGQSLLTAMYQSAFLKRNIAVAQILVTDDDFVQTHREAELRRTLRHLLELSVVPIINENDAVTHSPECDPETRLLSDNDVLAALIAKTINAHLLVLLTDVDGVYTSHPRDKDALLIPQMTGSAHLFNSAETISELGRGGMQAKVEAASRAAKESNLVAVIANGRIPNVLHRIMEGQRIGTLIAARENQ
jgi:glutamate 5-kinase